MSILSNRRVIVLDTSPVRNLAYSNKIPEWVKIFSKMKKNGYLFTLSECTFGELLKQKNIGAMSEKEFRNLIGRLKIFLSMTLPVMPGEVDVLRLIGSEPHYNFHDNDIKAISKKAFRMLVDQKVNYTEILIEELERERSEWRNLIFNLDQIHSQDSEEFDEISDYRLDMYIKGHDRDRVMDPPLSRRLDLRTRYIWRQYVRSKKKNEPYNVNAPKKANDGIDLRIYTYLALPALIVAEDNGFFGSIENIPSFQKSWIMKSDDLANSWANRTLKFPEW
ncbi:hypothetical protein JK208_15040 [Gluconobacter sp. Dm-74]|uniref:hypothetical protein n=1 Tax=Gluconobacter sp. Dm-74 TaxID=2799803 RepID=UPI001B8CDEA1|nr:hypothetical protein [Gluconobacter sp. Dm-74]MBS1092887.1 hypothetical protein [Gluconobacter sp. Dm-74]